MHYLSIQDHPYYLRPNKAMKTRRSEAASHPQTKAPTVVSKTKETRTEMKHVIPKVVVVTRRRNGRSRKSSCLSNTSNSSSNSDSDSDSDSDSGSSSGSGTDSDSESSGSSKASSEEPMDSSQSSDSDESSDSSSSSESSESSDDEEVTPPPAKKRVVRKKRWTMEVVEYNPQNEIDHARKQEGLRRLRPKQEERGPVQMTEKEFKKMARDNMKRTEQLFSYLKQNEDGMDKKASKKLLKTLRFKKVPEEIEDKINEIIVEGVKLQVMKAQRNRKCITVEKVKLYINEEQFGAKISEKAQFEYTDKNFVSSAPEDAQLREDLAKMNSFKEHKDMCCSCKGNCNPKTCLCLALQKEFSQSEIADRHRYYTCGPGCACKGKCSSSLFVPEGGTEVMLHQHTPKGFAVRALQFFFIGAMVAEMTGEITNTANLQVMDDYSIDMTSIETDFKAILAILENKRVKSKLVRDFMNRLSKKFKNHLKKVLSFNYSINPINFSTIGRFLSSSCSPNVVPSVVFSQGLNPLNVRCMFRAIMPIFPNQEIAFSYSDEYIYQQLRDICKCGSLCCIRHRELYPYLRFHHFQKFFELLYTSLFEDYRKNVLEPVDNEIRRRLRSSSTPLDGAPSKKRKLAPAVSVSTHRVKRSRRKRIPVVPF